MGGQTWTSNIYGKSQTQFNSVKICICPEDLSWMLIHLLDATSIWQQVMDKYRHTTVPISEIISVLYFVWSYEKYVLNALLLLFRSIQLLKCCNGIQAPNILLRHHNLYTNVLNCGGFVDVILPWSQIGTNDI